MPKLNSRGFSYIELVIISFIIFALGAVIYINYNSLRQKERDTERKGDITLLQRELESYQAQYGNYPTLKDINNSVWRAKYLKNFDSSTLQDPLSKFPILLSSPQAKAYAYQPTPDGCNNGENSSEKIICTGYTLTATLETGSTFVQKNFN